MTARIRITESDLRRAARIAAEAGVEVAIEASGKVYRIAPPGATLRPATDAEQAECDRAFGMGGQ